MFLLQHIDKVFKHKELQQQLMDAKLQRITEMMKEVEEKQQREREFVRSASLHHPNANVVSFPLEHQIAVVHIWCIRSDNISSQY